MFISVWARMLSVAHPVDFIMVSLNLALLLLAVVASVQAGFRTDGKALRTVQTRLTSHTNLHYSWTCPSCCDLRKAQLHPQGSL